MANKPTDDLTIQQKRFVDEYLFDFNGTRAAIRAGYSPKSAEQQAVRMLGYAKVANAIEEKRQRLSIKTEIKAEKVLQEIARIAFSDMRNLATWEGQEVFFKSSSEITDDMAACISEITSTTIQSKSGKKVNMKIKLHDKMRAIEMLAKNLNLLVNQDQNGQNPIAITPENIAELCRAAREGAQPKPNEPT